MYMCWRSRPLAGLLPLFVPHLLFPVKSSRLVYLLGLAVSAGALPAMDLQTLVDRSDRKSVV